MFNRGVLLVFLFSTQFFADAVPAKLVFFQAIQRADAGPVKRLLSQGISPNVQDTDGTPALMAAILYAGTDCVKLLLDHGADANATNAAGATALMWAIPDIPKVKLLLEHGANVNARSTNLDRTPLLIAASYPGSVEVLRLLLSKGADIHAKDKRGMGALGRATSTADVEVVRLLVDNGLDPNGDEYGVARLGRWSRHYLPTIEYLMSKGVKVDKNALSLASNWQDPTLLQKWIDMGADVNARGALYRQTPLIRAAASEQARPATLKLLLDHGADANAEDVDGERALDWAVYRADRGKIEMLEQYGAKQGHGPRKATYPPPEQTGISDAKTSLSRSVALLLPATPAVFETRRCITCHSQTLPAEAAAAARRKGVGINEEMAQKNLKQILTIYEPAAEGAMQGDSADPAYALSVGYVMGALAAERYPLNKTTAAFTHYVAAMQMPDGSWLGNGVSRPPMEDSTVSTTAMAVRTLMLYPIPGNKNQEKLRKARTWLLAAEARSAEERSMRLMGLVWTAASRSQIQSAIQDIIAQQRGDGGWSQRDELQPDAYGTGLSLYALHEAGVAVTSDVYRRGIAFLLETQYQNGSWFVKTRSFPTQPFLDTGYPFGRNQMISAAGAGWASLAIAYTLPDVNDAESANGRHKSQ